MAMSYQSTGPVCPLLAGEAGVAKLARENHFQLHFLTLADMIPNLSAGKLGIYRCPCQLKTFSLFVMHETVLAKGGDPKTEQVTCLKTEFLPFNS